MRLRVYTTDTPDIASNSVEEDVSGFYEALDILKRRSAAKK